MKQLCAFLLIVARLGGEDAIGRPADGPRADEEPIAMTVVAVGDTLQRIYLPIDLDGRRRYVIVDCGTPRFWIVAPKEKDRPEWADDAFVATLGGRRMHVVGRRVSGPRETIEGQQPVGAIGNDWLLAGTLVLDLREGTLARLPRGTVPSEASEWPSVPFKLEQGLILLDATFDGEQVQALLDSGASKSLWLGQRGKKGDLPGETHDVHGETLRYWLGTMDLGLGDDSREVAVQRMERFPHLEAVGERLGVPIDGLIGLSSLGRRRVVLDPEAGRVLLEPSH